MGRVLHSNVTCTEVMNHIKPVKHEITHSIINQRNKISIILDESTSMCNQTVLIGRVQ